MKEGIMAHTIQRILTVVRSLPKGSKALLASAAGLIVLLWPRKTSPLSYISMSQRDRWYGPIQYIPMPTENNPEGISITNDFYAQNIVRRAFPIIGVASIHRLAAPSLDAALTEIQRNGWADKIRSYEGGYYPRFVRGSNVNLSSHSYGTSIDINAGSNPQGLEPTDDQRLLAPIFEKHGWYWGDRFNSKRDPMHFEFVLQPKGVS